MMLRRGAWQCGKRLAAQGSLGGRRSFHLCSSSSSRTPTLLALSSLPRPSSIHASSRHHHYGMLTAAPFQRYKGECTRAFSSAPNPTSITLQEEEKLENKAASKSEEEPATTPGPPTPLFSSPAQRFFRLLAGASLTQVAFWTSYAFLPAELSGSMGYWGIFGSGAFVLIARHFAMHYVWEMDQISPVAFRICAHTFWGNKGPERIVQIGTTKCQHTSRYIAAKVKGDSFYYLLDIKEGKFATDESEEQILRIFHGLKTDAYGRNGDDDGEDEGGSGAGAGRRKSGGRRWKGGWKGKA